ncbi:MAG: hypothetical protein ACYC0M_10530 [Burkholderiales bacterium]
MMEKLVLRRGFFYEGDSQDLRAIHPTPTISSVTCPFITSDGGNVVIFREDSFDPVTRIRRGRLYIGGRRGEGWASIRVDDGFYRQFSPYGQASQGNNWQPDESYDAWQANDIHPKDVNGQIVRIGANGYVTPWRIVDAEHITIGHVLLTLRANSLLGVIPELVNEITDKDGNTVDSKPVQAALDSLVDAFHRQQAIPTVDVARETARVILTYWIGQSANTKDLGKVINEIPKNKDMAQWAASIINRLHPRGKSAEQENQAANGVRLRPVAWEDTEVSVHLVGMLLREIGWA